MCFGVVSIVYRLTLQAAIHHIVRLFVACSLKGKILQQKKKTFQFFRMTASLKGWHKRWWTESFCFASTVCSSPQSIDFDYKSITLFVPPSEAVFYRFSQERIFFRLVFFSDAFRFYVISSYLRTFIVFCGIKIHKNFCFFLCRRWGRRRKTMGNKWERTNCNKKQTQKKWKFMKQITNLMKAFFTMNNGTKRSEDVDVFVIQFLMFVLLEPRA